MKFIYTRIILLSLSLFFFLKCQNKNEVKDEVKSDIERLTHIQSKRINSHKIVMGDTILITVDSVTSNVTKQVEYCELSDETKYILIMNHNILALDFYDISKGTLAKRIVLPESGPKGLGRVTGFRYVSMDSIFLINPYSVTLRLVDSALNVKKKYMGYDKNTEREKIFTSVFPRSGSRYLPVITQDWIHMKGSSPNDMNPEFYKNALNMVSVNLHSDQINNWLRFPKNYYDDRFYSYYYEEQSFTRSHKGAESIVVQFPANPSIYLVNNQEIREIVDTPKSKYYDSNITSLKANPPDSKLHLEHNLTNPFFSQIIYDEFTHLYYRFILLPVDYNEKYLNTRRFLIPRPFVLEVYNEDFNLIAEKRFDDDFAPYLSFGTPSGFYVYMLQGDEDIMQFVGINIIEK